MCNWLKEKALEISQKFEMSFKASDQWLFNFKKKKKRFNLTIQLICGEKAKVDKECFSESQFAEVRPILKKRL